MNANTGVLLNTLDGKKFMGKVEKLSNIGWSYHHRLLKMD